MTVSSTPATGLKSGSGRYDPLLCDVPLPFQMECFPMGFPLEIATNSQEVLAAAAALWSRYPRLSHPAALRLCVAVETRSTPATSSPPVLRGKEHLFSIVQDSQNASMADLAGGFGFAWLTRDRICDRAYLRYHFLEPLVYALLTARHFTLAHASCVSLDGRAVLLCGDSAAGKTCLAFECARRGWTFLSGDAVGMLRHRSDYTVIGRPLEIRFRETAQLLFPELQGYQAALRPSGKFDIEADPYDLNLTLAFEGKASHIVFLDRVPECVPASVEFFPREEARRQLESAICFGDEPMRRDQHRTLSHFLNLPIQRLRYAELGAAERILRNLVLKGN